MKKLLCALIIAGTLATVAAAQENAVLGSWMIWQDEELMEVIFGNDNVLTTKNYSSYNATADVETDHYMIMDDIIIIDGDIYNYFLVNDKLVMTSYYEQLVFSRKTVNSTAEVKRLIVGTWAAEIYEGSETYTMEFTFSADGRAVARAYTDGGRLEEGVTSYAITDTNILYFKADDTYYAFRVTANKLFIASMEGLIFTKR
jgi:hypothetical protein